MDNGTVINAIVHEVPTEEGGGYWAEIPDLPGCATQGETIDEVVYNVREAVRGVLAVMKEEALVPRTRNTADNNTALRGRDLELILAV